MTKSYQLTFAEESGYVHFRVTGKNSRETVRGYFADIYDTCVKNEYREILIEEHLEGPGLGLFDIFEVVSEESEKAWRYLRRIAFVDTNPEHSVPDMMFAETVATNRGVNTRMFHSVAEAEGWLSESPALSVRQTPKG
jgi:hypothetical protein